MSREQWGHGYWSGVRDAEMNGVKMHSFCIEDFTVECLRQMARFSRLRGYDFGLCSVKDFRAWILIEFADADKLAKDVYDYVMINNPFGCYIGGDQTGEWTEDYFVLSRELGEE